MDVVLVVVGLGRIEAAVVLELGAAEGEELLELASEVLVGVHVDAVVAGDVRDAVEIVEVGGIVVEGAHQVLEVPLREGPEEPVLVGHELERGLLAGAAHEVVVPEEDELLAGRDGGGGGLGHLLDPPALHLEPPVVADVVRRRRLPSRRAEGQELVDRVGYAGVTVVELLDLLGRPAEADATEQMCCVLEVPDRHEVLRLVG